MLEEMTNHLMGATNKGQIMYELATCISSAINADAVNLYLVESEGQLSKFVPKESDMTMYVQNWLKILKQNIFVESLPNPSDQAPP